MKENEKINLTPLSIPSTTLEKKSFGYIIRYGRNSVPLAKDEAIALAKLILEDNIPSYIKGGVVGEPPAPSDVHRGQIG